jgi:Helix-turn-helix domain of transposase family ISL3
VRLYRPLGWQPSCFLTDRAEAERAFQLAEQLGSVNAVAAELGTTWPSLRKAFTRHAHPQP